MKPAEEKREIEKTETNVNDEAAEKTERIEKESKTNHVRPEKIRIYGIGIVAVAAVSGLLAAIAAKRSSSDNQKADSVSIIGGADHPTSIDLSAKTSDAKKTAAYTSISMEEAAKVFEVPGDYIIVDVRHTDEFAEGHIPGAINVVNEEIGAERPKELPKLDQVIYVYCRSGRRSKEASAKLAALGYTNIYEFGGIIDWTGKIEKT